MLALLAQSAAASDLPAWCHHSPFWASFPLKTPSAPGYAPHGEQPLWQPATQGPDGPLAGNGDLGAVIGRGLRGGPFAVYSGKNDLWSGNQAGGVSDDPDPAKANADWIDSWGYSKLPGAWIELGASRRALGQRCEAAGMDWEAQAAAQNLPIDQRSFRLHLRCRQFIGKHGLRRGEPIWASDGHTGFA